LCFLFLFLSRQCEENKKGLITFQARHNTTQCRHSLFGLIHNIRADWSYSRPPTTTENNICALQASTVLTNLLLRKIPQNTDPADGRRHTARRTGEEICDRQLSCGWRPSSTEWDLHLPLILQTTGTDREEI
jgi:hypothetical protein